MISVDEAIDALLGAYCRDCGAGLPRRGEQCAACGTFPPVTRPEMAEKVSPPNVHARWKPTGCGRKPRNYRRWRPRSSPKRTVLHVTELERIRDKARARADAAWEAVRPLETPEKETGAAEAAALGDLDAARDAHRKAAQAEEAARRLRKGPDAERDALIQLDAASRVLQRYQAADDQAAATHRAALQRLAAAQHEVAAWRPGTAPRRRQPPALAASRCRSIASARTCCAS